MRILHITEVCKGGTLTVLQQLAVHQILEFGSNNVLCLIPDSAARELQNVPSNSIRTYHRRGRNLVSILNLYTKYISTIAQFQPDIIHLHSSFAGFICRFTLPLIKMFSKIKVVYCPHAWCFLMDTSQTVAKGCALTERLLAFATDKIICVSASELAHAIAAQIQEKKLIQINNGVDVPATSANSENADARIEDPISALFVGRPSQQKGFDILMSAMSLLPTGHVRLKVIGSTQSDSGSLETSEDIEYLGWQPQRNLQTYYESADVVVLPSRWEGLPMVALEAGANGTAVLASNIDALSEIIIPGLNGQLFPVGDSQKLAECLQSCSKLEWQKMGGEAKKIISERFDLVVTQRKTINVYRECLGQLK